MDAIGIRRTVPVRWSARRALIGDWSLSPLLWLVSTPFIVTVQYGRLQESFVWPSPQLLAVSVLGQVLALAVLLASRRIRGRLPGDRVGGLVVVLLIWFVAGGAAGAVTALFLAEFQLISGSRGFGVVFLMGMTTMLVYALVSFTIGVLRGHREEVDRLRAYRDVLVLRNQESGAFADDQRRLLRAALDEEILPAFQDLGERVEALSYRPEQEELEQLRLRVVITSESVARRVDEGIDRAVQGRRAKRLVRISRGRPTEGGWMSILLGSSVPALLGCVIVVLFSATERFRGCLTLSIIMAIGMILVVLAGAAVRRLISGEPPGARLAVGAVTIASLILVYWGMTRGEFAGCTWRGSTELFITSAVTLTGALVFAGVSVEADRQLRLMGKELGLANDGTRAAIEGLDEAGRTLRDQVSSVLNGVLQGRLGGVAIALQSHLDELDRGGRPSSERLVADVTLLLRLAEQDIVDILTGPLQPLPIDEALMILRVRWAGLLAIEWEIDDGALALLDDDVKLLRWASGIIEHSVSNASRHGSATTVTIRVSTAGATSGWLRIHVSDNGTGPTGEAVSVGAAARAVTDRGGTWALKVGQREGAELTVDLPGTRWSNEASDDRS